MNVIAAGPVGVAAVVGPPGSNTLLVTFNTSQGAGGLSFNGSARCPPVILPVYCDTAGFEVLLSGGDEWVNVPALPPFAGNTTVVLQLPAMAASQTVQAVRYAHADWPVCPVRNRIGGLPARGFLLDMTAGPKR